MTIRFYEKSGLLPPPDRTKGNYRNYTQAHLERLRFIRQANELGFDTASVRALLALIDAPEAPGAIDLAQKFVSQADAKISQLRVLHHALTTFATEPTDQAAAFLLQALGKD